MSNDLTPPSAHGGEKGLDFIFNLFGAAVAAGVGAGITAPFAQPFTRAIHLVQAEGVTPARPAGTAPGVVSVLRSTTRDLGVAANWRGSLWKIGSSTAIAPVKAIPVKDAIMRQLPHVDPRKDILTFSAYNACAGACAGLMLYPATLIKKVPQVLTNTDVRVAAERQGGMAHLRAFVGTPGAFTFVGRSLIPLHLGAIVLNRATQFGLNDTINAVNPYRRDPGLSGLLSKFTVAQVSVTAAAAAAYPMHLLSTRVIVSGATVPVDQRTIHGVTSAARQVVGQHGILGLYKGFPAQVMLGVGSACALVLYGELKVMFGS